MHHENNLRDACCHLANIIEECCRLLPNYLALYYVYHMHGFLADRTNGRAYATVLRLSSVCLSSVCNVMYCG